MMMGEVTAHEVEISYSHVFQRQSVGSHFLNYAFRGKPPVPSYNLTRANDPQWGEKSVRSHTQRNAL